MYSSSHEDVRDAPFPPSLLDGFLYIFSVIGWPRCAYLKHNSLHIGYSHWHLVARSLSRSTRWCTSMTLRAKSILILTGVSSVHIGITTDQFLLEQRFLIDIKFDSNHLVFPGVNHIIYMYTYLAHGCS